jgi:hypothetical protein
LTDDKIAGYEKRIEKDEAKEPVIEAAFTRIENSQMVKCNFCVDDDG